MAILSMRARKKAWGAVSSALVASLAWLLQLTVLNNFSFQDTICSLPLTLTILWGFVFGSSLPPISAEELRTSSAGEIFLRQLASGSVSGALLGAFFAALYASVLPIYPICFPIIGWICGYFNSPKLNKETLMCVPVVLFATVMAEFIMTAQLMAVSYPEALSHLSQIALPEALLNALIAPFVYFPMRGWYDFSQSSEVIS